MECNYAQLSLLCVLSPSRFHCQSYQLLPLDHSGVKHRIVGSNHTQHGNMSRASISTPSPQGKLKRVQDYDIDLEAGSSKKKLVLSDPGSQHLESQAQPENQQASGEKPSFRVIGHFVMAMKRFQASINPTYTYGKVTEDSGASDASSGDFIHPAQRILRKTESQNGTGQERAMKKTFSSRGNKTSLLFKQLPDVPPET